jgi:hypothetical protein
MAEALARRFSFRLLQEHHHIPLDYSKRGSALTRSLFAFLGRRWNGFGRMRAYQRPLFLPVFMVLRTAFLLAAAFLMGGLEAFLATG